MLSTSAVDGWREAISRQWHPTPVLLPGKSHGRSSLVGCSPWGRQESDTTERLRFHFSLSCIGEGNGNPLQCSCLENPRDSGAWWAAIYGVTQGRTRLKRLSSSSSSSNMSDVGILDFNTQRQFSASQSFSLFIVSNKRLLFLIGSKRTSDCEAIRPLFLSHD